MTTGPYTKQNTTEQKLFYLVLSMIYSPFAVIKFIQRTFTTYIISTLDLQNHNITIFSIRAVLYDLSKL